MRPSASLVFALLVSSCVASAAQGASVLNVFKSSSTGVRDIFVGDTIQFEVVITTDPGVNYNTVLWSLTGDAVAALLGTVGSPWHAIENEVSRWEWHYTPAGGSKVKMGTNGRISTRAPAIPTPDTVSGAYGFAGISKTGDGIPAMVGTVTLLATAPGAFEGGAFQYPGVDGFLGSGGGGVVPFSGGDFYVNVPEPGSAMLVAAGLAGIAARRRRVGR